MSTEARDKLAGEFLKLGIGTKNGRNLFHSRQKQCTFCSIINENKQNQLLFKNDKIAIFEDIRPAATHHLLGINDFKIPRIFFKIFSPVMSHY